MFNLLSIISRLFRVLKYGRPKAEKGCKNNMASATFTALDAFQKAVDAETTRIAGEVQKMLDTIAGGLSPAEAQTLIDASTPLVDHLKAIGSGGAVVPPPPSPIPPA
jgi:hypothetical protein